MCMCMCFGGARNLRQAVTPCLQLWSFPSANCLLAAASYFFVQKPVLLVFFYSLDMESWTKRPFSKAVELKNILHLNSGIYRDRPHYIWVPKVKAKANKTLCYVKSWKLTVLTGFLKKKSPPVSSFFFFLNTSETYLFCLVLWGSEVDCDLLVASSIVFLSSKQLYTFLCNRSMVCCFF